MPRCAALAVAVLVGAVAGACTADDGADSEAVTPSTEGDAAAGSAADPGLRATLQRSTLFETRRALRLSLRNTGADDVEIGTVQLATPLFEPVGPEERDAPLDAGGRPVDIPLAFGTARCDDDVPDAAGAELVATVDGEERRVALEEVPSGVLADLRAAECAAAAVLAEVDIRLGDRWTATGPRAITGEMEVSQRNPGVSAAVDEVLGNVIFAVGTAPDASSGGPWLAIDDAQPSGRIPLTIEAARCDPHALTEYKRTFIFVALVAVDDDPPVRVDVEAEGPAHRALEQLLASCLE